MKKCPKCGRKYGGLDNRCMECRVPLEEVAKTITVQCLVCNKQSELEIEPSSGIKLRCPYCSTKFRSLRRGPKPLEYYYSRFRLFHFRSPLLAESRLISFPPGT